MSPKITEVPKSQNIPHSKDRLVMLVAHRTIQHIHCFQVLGHLSHIFQSHFRYFQVIDCSLPAHLLCSFFFTPFGVHFMACQSQPSQPSLFHDFFWIHVACLFPNFYICYIMAFLMIPGILCCLIQNIHKHWH